MSKALEQDKYSLQKEVELKTRMLESLQSDHDCVKNQQRRQLQEQQEHLERSHSTAVNELNNKVQRPVVWSTKQSPVKGFFSVDILTCHSRNITGVSNNINDGSESHCHGLLEHC